MTKKTKMFFVLIAALLAAAVLLGACAGLGGGGAASTGGRKVSSRVPDFIRKAIMNAPEDALVGVGSAKMATDNMSRTIATTRARAEISRQMSTMIQDMIRDYTAASEVDPSAVISFQENITVALSKAELKGSTVLDMDFTDDGTCWVVVLLGKTNAAQEINQAQAAAKLRIPAMASFNAEERMNEAFDKANKTEVTYSGDDTPAVNTPEPALAPANTPAKEPVIAGGGKVSGRYWLDGKNTAGNATIVFSDNGTYDWTYGKGTWKESGSKLTVIVTEGIATGGAKERTLEWTIQSAAQVTTDGGHVYKKGD